MPQLLHLLIVDRARRSALAARYGQHWLLPVLTSRERTRVNPLIARWLADRDVPGNIVGHWLGRLTPAQDGVDWLVAVDGTPGTVTPNPQLIWTSLDSLASSPSVLEYQQWAVSTSLQLGALPSVPGPFGNLAWLEDVKAWICRATGVPELGTLAPYRVTAHEMVLGIETGHQRVYFKGLPCERSGEARLTAALSELAPRAFAQTLALEPRPDGSIWWLTSECPGRDLVGRSDVQMVPNVARALVRVQRDAWMCPTVVRELKPVPLADAAEWAADLLKDHSASNAIERACAAVAGADLPGTWIPLDLDPANVLVDEDGRVSFIDLDDSLLGPPPLAMAMFGRRSRDRSGYEPYRQAWVPLFRRIDWQVFELAAAVLEAWLGWKRVVKNTERGELRGVLDVAAARLALRLAADVTGRPAPRPAP